MDESRVEMLHHLSVVFLSSDECFLEGELMGCDGCRREMSGNFCALNSRGGQFCSGVQIGEECMDIFEEVSCGDVSGCNV